MNIKSKFSVMRWRSPLLRRIILFNLLPIILFSFILLSMNEFQKFLIVESVIALREELYIYKGGLLDKISQDNGGFEKFLSKEEVKKRLEKNSQYAKNAHILYYSRDWQLWADIRRGIEFYPKGGVWFAPCNSFFDSLYGRLLSLIPANIIGIPYYSDKHIIYMENYAFNLEGMKRNISFHEHYGVNPAYIRRISYNRLAITVMEPLIYKGDPVGYLQLTRRAPDIDEGIFLIRSTILSLLLVMIGMTLIFSLYLFWTIARPISLLVRASEKICKKGEGRVDTFPQHLLERKDEIGILARALRENNYALWARLDAIERFASEVSHELKNPLASIRSALETLPFIVDQSSRGRLFAIVRDDVCRLQRLISDISEASRLEGDLSRGKREIIALVPLISLLVEMHQTARREDEPYLRLAISKGEEKSFSVLALEDRLVQVLRNIMSNALSFSPPRGVIMITLSIIGGEGAQKNVKLSILDEGPGISEEKLESIFERFYSERPKKEGFDQHSGLGLAMSRQIIEAFGGKIYAENRIERDSKTGEMRIKGANFIIHLPLISTEDL